EAIGRQPQPVLKVPTPQAVVPPPAPKRLPPRPEAIPTVLPAPTLRGQVAELCGSLALAAVLAVVSTTLWTALAPNAVARPNIYQAYFLPVATCWAVLVPAKFWNNRRGDSWARRLLMMALGVLVGLGAIWLDGWVPLSIGGVGDESVPVLRKAW